ncbi:MAG: peptidylprolyl isomerase [Clostridia bacterium]|nr:peptidylprolyl isomerase [Clostridia bacterium]
MQRILAIFLTLTLLCTALMPLAMAEEEDTLIVTVNGEEIYQTEVENYAEDLISYYSQYGYDLSSDENRTLVNQMAMDYILQSKFITQEAHRLGLDAFSEEEIASLNETIDSVYESLISQAMSAYGITPADDATDEDKDAARSTAITLLDSMGYTKAYIQTNETEELLTEKLMAVLTEGLSVTSEEVEQAFQERAEADRESYEGNTMAYEFQTGYYGQESYYVPEGFRGVTHILLKVDDELLNTYQDLVARLEEQEAEAETETQTEAETETQTEAETETETVTEEAKEEEEGEEKEEETPVTQADVDAARDAILASVQDTIDAIHTKMDAGVSFAELIEEYGEDPGMTVEPNKSNGYSVSADSILYDPIFVDAAFSVDHVGDVSEPVISSFGVHLVQYTRDVPSGIVELTDDIRASLEEELLSNKEQDALNTAFTAWKEASEIVYTEAGEAYRPEVQENAEDAEPLE